MRGDTQQPIQEMSFFKPFGNVIKETLQTFHSFHELTQQAANFRKVGQRFPAPLLDEPLKKKKNLKVILVTHLKGI